MASAVVQFRLLVGLDFQRKVPNTKFIQKDAEKDQKQNAKLSNPKTKKKSNLHFTCSASAIYLAFAARRVKKARRKKANQGSCRQPALYSNQEYSLATAKKARLVQQGIEPNPGPSQSQRNAEFTIRFSSLNTQGVRGAWRALKHFNDQRVLTL